MRSKIASLFVLALMFSAVSIAQTNTASAAAPATAAASAPTGPLPTKLGVINVQVAIAATNEGRRDYDTLTKQFEPKQAELKTLSDQIEADKKQLSAQGDKLNEDARATLVRNIESKQKVLQRNYEDAQNEFNTAQGELVNKIGQKMMAIIDKFAQDNNYAMILDISGQGNPVLWAPRTVDITQTIVESYNAQSGVAAPAGGAAAAPQRPTGGTRPATGATRPAGTATRPAGTTAPATTTPKKPATTTPR